MHFRSLHFFSGKILVLCVGVCVCVFVGLDKWYIMYLSVFNVIVHRVGLLYSLFIYISIYVYRYMHIYEYF